MVFAPRFERVEEELEVGAFLTADAQPGDAVLHVDNASALLAGRYFIGDASSEERVLSVSVDSGLLVRELGHIPGGVGGPA